MTKERRGRGRTSAGEIQAKHTLDTVVRPPVEMGESREDSETIEAFKAEIISFLREKIPGVFMFEGDYKFGIDFCELQAFDYATMSKKKWNDDKIYITLSTKTLQDFKKGYIREQLEAIRLHGGAEFKNEPVFQALGRVRLLSTAEPLNLWHLIALAKYPRLVPPELRRDGTYIFPAVIFGRKFSFVLSMTWNSSRQKMNFDYIGLNETWSSKYYMPTVTKS